MFIPYLYFKWNPNHRKAVGFCFYDPLEEPPVVVERKGTLKAHIYFQAPNSVEQQQLSAEDKYRRWLGELFEASTRQICALAHHSKPAVGQLAVVTLMNLMQAQHRRNSTSAEGKKERARERD